MQISERMTPLLCADAVGLVTLTRRHTNCGLTVRYVAYAPPSESVFRCQGMTTRYSRATPGNRLVAH